VNVLLITARDPREDAGRPARVASAAAVEGHEVALVLLESAVTLARADHRDADALATAVAAGVRVLAEDEALARHAVVRIADAVKPTDLGEVVDLLFGWSERRAWL